MVHIPHPLWPIKMLRPRRFRNDKVEFQVPSLHFLLQHAAILMQITILYLIDELPWTHSNEWRIPKYLRALSTSNSAQNPLSRNWLLIHTAEKMIQYYTMYKNWLLHHTIELYLSKTIVRPCVCSLNFKPYNFQEEKINYLPIPSKTRLESEQEPCLNIVSSLMWNPASTDDPNSNASYSLQRISNDHVLTTHCAFMQNLVLQSPLQLSQADCSHKFLPSHCKGAHL